jgi:hypothetical protein
MSNNCQTCGNIYDTHTNTCSQCCNDCCNDTCDENEGCPILLSDKCVFYRGSETLNFLNLEPDDSLRTFFIKLNNVLETINPDYIDFNSLDLDCFIATNISEFIEETCNKVCTLTTSFNNYVISNNLEISTIKNDISSLENVIINSSPIQTFTRNDFDNFVYTEILNLSNYTDISNIDWNNYCFTFTSEPEDIKEGFEALLLMMCSLQTSINSWTPDNKKVLTSITDTTDGFLSDKIVSDCLNITVDNSNPNDLKLKIEPKSKTVDYIFNPSHFNIIPTDSSDCKEEYSISLQPIPSSGLTSIGLILDNVGSADDIFSVSNSPLISNGNLELAFKDVNTPLVLRTTNSNLQPEFGLIETDHLGKGTINVDRLTSTSFSLFGNFGISGDSENIEYNTNDFSLVGNKFSIKPSLACFVTDQPYEITKVLSGVTINADNVSLTNNPIPQYKRIGTTPSNPSIFYRFTRDGYLHFQGSLQVVLSVATSHLGSSGCKGRIDIELLELPSCYDNFEFETFIDSDKLIVNTTPDESLGVMETTFYIYKAKGTNKVYLSIEVFGNNLDSSLFPIDYVSKCSLTSKVSFLEF